MGQKFSLHNDCIERQVVDKRFKKCSGGETIREINRQSGAHVELDRNPPPNMAEKIFNIRGTPQQIQHAIQLICEKTGMQVCTFF